MKNLFKFGFLGLALSIGFASCGGATEQTATDATETVAEGVENATEQAADSLENVADSVKAVGDSIVDSLENVQ